MAFLAVGEIEYFLKLVDGYCRENVSEENLIVCPDVFSRNFLSIIQRPMDPQPHLAHTLWMPCVQRPLPEPPGTPRELPEPPREPPATPRERTMQCGSFEISKEISAPCGSFEISSGGALPSTYATPVLSAVERGDMPARGLEELIDELALTMVLEFEGADLLDEVCSFYAHTHMPHTCTSQNLKSPDELALELLPKN